MGTWEVSITGNDTAQDLKSEYQAAFFYFDVETAFGQYFSCIVRVLILAPAFLR